MGSSQPGRTPEKRYRVPPETAVAGPSRASSSTSSSPASWTARANGPTRHSLATVALSRAARFPPYPYPPDTGDRRYQAILQPVGYPKTRCVTLGTRCWLDLPRFRGRLVLGGDRADRRGADRNDGLAACRGAALGAGRGPALAGVLAVGEPGAGGVGGAAQAAGGHAAHARPGEPTPCSADSGSGGPIARCGGDSRPGGPGRGPTRASGPRWARHAARAPGRSSGRCAKPTEGGCVTRSGADGRPCRSRHGSTSAVVA